MDGTIISNGQGQYKILKGGQWVDYSGPPPGAKGGNGRGGKTGMSQQEQMYLNKLSSEAAEASETARIYDRAERSLKEFKPGPYRGQFVQMATPEDNGGILDKIGGVVLGVPARATGAISQKDTDNYQTLRGLQNKQVLQEQLAQKGPQTESDAARMMLTEISPSKGIAPNMDIINRGRQRLNRVRARASFYTQWANKYGLNGTNEKGETADGVWTANQDALTASMFKPKPKAGPTGITVLSRTKVR